MQTTARTALTVILLSFLPLGLKAHVAGVTAAMATVYVNRGDVNGDGRLNVSDVMLMARIALGEVKEYNKAQADVNESGDVNVTDVMTLVRWILDGYVYSNEDIQIPVVPGEGGSTPGGGWGPAQAPQNPVWDGE